MTRHLSPAGRPGAQVTGVIRHLVKVGTPITPPPTSPGVVPSLVTPARTTRREVNLEFTDTNEAKALYIAYGVCQFTPLLVHVEIPTGSTMYLVYSLGEGEIDSVSSVLYNSTQIWDGSTNKTSWAQVQFKPGSLAQTAFSNPPPSWPASTQPGHALLYIQVNLTSAEIPGGNPDVQVICKGRKLYDFRTTTTAWSDNPILIAYDLWTNAEYGAGVSAALLDVAGSWTVAANRCDETVNSQARWRASLVVTSRQPVNTLIADLLLSTCAGFIYWADGLWYVSLDEQHLIGCRPTGTTAVGTSDRAQSFTAPGPRIKPTIKLDLAAGFTMPRLRLRSTLAGGDLALASPGGYVNLLLANDGSFETDVSGWATSGTLTRDTSQYWTGVASAKTVAGAVSIATQLAQANAPCATAGVSYTASTYIKGEAGKSVQFLLRFYDASYTNLGADVTANLSTDGTWQRVTASGAAPVNTAFAAVRVVNSYAGAHTWYMDGVQLEAATAASTWQAGLAAGTGQELNFDLSSYQLTKGSTYYLVLLATTGVTWHQISTDQYSGGSSWYYSGSWTQESTKDFWFQCHYADWEITDALTCGVGQIPILANGNKSSLSFSRAHQEAPNVVIGNYFDVATWLQTEVRYEGPTVQTGADQPRELRQQMLATPTQEQAYRLVRQWYFLSQRTLHIGVTLPQHAIQIAPGDVVALTSTIGPFNAVWCRVQPGPQRGFGTFSLELVPYFWSDYSREETPTLDTITIPSAQSTQKYLIMSDDFITGGLTTGTIGELLWTLVDAGSAIDYVQASGHPGILEIHPPAVLGAELKLDAASAKFAAKSVWASRWVWRVSVMGSGTYCGYVTDVFEVKIYGTAMTLYVDGSSTGLTCTTSDWIRVENYSDGGGTAYCMIFKNGVLWYSTSKAVSDTGINKYLIVGGYGGTSVTIQIDLGELKLGVVR